MPKLYVILVTIVIGLENMIFFWPKVTFLFLNIPRGREGGSTSLGNYIPQKFLKFFGGFH